MKQAMALSGLFFVFFVVFHSYGNLKFLGGPLEYNGYAHHLRTFLMPILPYEGLLWILRVILLVLLIVHVYSAFYLWHRGGAARGTRYDTKKSAAGAYAARTMRWGGVILGLFLIFHIFHFTTKHIVIGNAKAYGAMTYMEHGEAVPTAPYNMMATTFSNWYMVLIYGIAIAALCLHISHGFWSALQSFGWIRVNTRKATVFISGVIGALVFVMFMIPPFYILITQPGPFYG